MKSIKDKYDDKWLIEGDFNDLPHNSKKKGGKLIDKSLSLNFLDTVNYCKYIYIGFKGNKFVWLK